VTFGLTSVVRDAIGAGDQVDQEGGVYLAGQLTGAAASTALGTAGASAIRSGSTMATSSASAGVATRVVNSRLGQALFGRGTGLFSGQRLRVGAGRGKDGRAVFRAAGELVEKTAGTKHIDLVDLGRSVDWINR
jgi:hypothetical protein